MYWEFYEQGSAQAVRAGHWKAVRKPMHSGQIELYDLKADLGETRNVAQDHPDVVAELRAIMEASHVESPHWQIRGQRRK